jgi:hypothetical protein
MTALLKLWRWSTLIFIGRRSIAFGTRLCSFGARCLTRAGFRP